MEKYCSPTAIPNHGGRKIHEQDISAAYRLESSDELNSERRRAIRKERDMLAWMSPDDPPIWMKNSMRGGPVRINDNSHRNLTPHTLGD